MSRESDVRAFLSEIRQCAAITELDETVLHRLIHKILVGEGPIGGRPEGAGSQDRV